MGKMKAVSLFSCIGVGEYFLKRLGIETVVANEIDPKRCLVYNFFHPETQMICGDITDKNVKKEILRSAKEHKIDLLLSTPPCQGMSSVGINRKDSSLHSDKRNLLILETVEIIDALSPNYVIIENVPRFLKVKYKYKGKLFTIVELLSVKYASNYNIKVDVFNAADFGVPQIRYRAFIRMWKKGLKWLDPIFTKTHITVADAIGGLPSLVAGEKSNIKNHWARVHPENQIKWLEHTPTGETAFNNKRFYPKCQDGRRIKGYRNCYRRIEWNKPAPAVTMRNEIISSQNNVHPGRKLKNNLWSDARVLTPRELLLITSLPPDMDLPANISDTALRQFIGEGIPPKMLFQIVKGIRR